MNPKFDLSYALRAIVWGFAHCAELHVVGTCVTIMVLGFLALYAIAATSLLMGTLALVVLVLACLVLYRYGMRFGPPVDDDDTDQAGA